MRKERSPRAGSPSVRAFEQPMAENAARCGPRRPRAIALSFCMALAGTVGPTSCAPIERIVVGDLSGEGGLGGTAGACVSDGEACDADGSCCSGSCSSGSCAALSDICLTAGNGCVSSAECCSGLCDDEGICSLASSYCVQPHDVCSTSRDCCT